jgi:PhnB protein
MAKSSNRVPPGFHSVTPHLVVSNSVKAIAFYKKAFGAEELMVMPKPDGGTMHAQIKIGDSIIMMADECTEFGNLSPESRGGATSSHMMYLEDVDAAFDKAVKAGCTVKVPLADQFWGDRYGVLTDPFGHQWSLGSHVEDLTAEELSKRSEAAYKQMAGAKA